MDDASGVADDLPIGPALDPLTRLELAARSDRGNRPRWSDGLLEVAGERMDGHPSRVLHFS